MDWMNTGILLVFYLAVGMISATIREYWRGAMGKWEDPDMFFAIIAFWPLVFPILWLWLLCRWVWAVGFNRNLPPLNSGPGRVVNDRRKR